ncbi:carboxypeptidase-like regulatory domain-containing protein [Hymenobacter humi]|uniref:Carboxypeptidase-like regulatory domain-containing protein n=1 Tax=Hymenobacter humi TaxID=1411620 RepID=A0ABW2U7D1_9BACT
MKTLLLLPLLLLSAARPATAQTPAPSAQLASATTHLAGTVRDAAGQPLPGVNVFLKTTFDGASTDSLGRFRFSTDHAAGPLLLVVSFIGYEPQELPVTLGQGAVSLPNINLKASRAQARRRGGDIRCLRGQRRQARRHAQAAGYRNHGRRAGRHCRGAQCPARHYAGRRERAAVRARWGGLGNQNLPRRPARANALRQLGAQRGRAGPVFAVPVQGHGV